jgi:hypothetical protein
MDCEKVPFYGGSQMGEEFQRTCREQLSLTSVRQAHGAGGWVDEDVNNGSMVGKTMVVWTVDERQAVEADRRGRKHVRVRRARYLLRWTTRCLKLYTTGTPSVTS